MADKKVNQQHFSKEEVFIKLISEGADGILNNDLNMQAMRSKMRVYWGQLTPEERKEHAQRFRQMTEKFKQYAEAVDQEFMMISVGDI